MRAVLFDLDGTLLDLDLSAFLRRYLVALEAASAPLAADAGTDTLLPALNAAVGLMTAEHPGRTNREVFYDALLERTGIDLHERWPVYEAFYRDVFPGLKEDAAPSKGSRRAVTTALDLGLGVAIATNPIFPRSAIDRRLEWAGLADLPLDVVTSYEIMGATKPRPEYFRQTAALLGVSPRDCLMVGDDRYLDMPAADVGMRTFYVGDDPETPADMCGDLDDLANVLARIV